MSDAEKRIDLLPCPFCGGEASIDKTDCGDERNGYNFYVVISCECGVSLKKPSRQDKNGWCNDSGQASKDATKAWNRRAAPIIRREIENSALERAAGVCDELISGD